ncbi:NADP-dependent oxidoreductase [Brevibacillus brevis]|uniref:NADP-dependent oxidoreductase n=1 Tax=Brevibacillus brevis TaxID=1393 RepID=A0ABY9T8M1_BREBE|nr:NADP-dependent oxidoreductase [Brevibacillus brevis]WNC16455.1 NADP-dependent oxidoreductase [Brevibacillus brevis]
MKAAGILTFGPPEVLQLIEVDSPQAGRQEVRVQVKAAGVQPFDLAVRSGWAPPGGEIRFPQVLGNEFAGIVDQVGEEVSGFSIGDEVIGFRVLGCQAEYVVVGPEQLVKKPKEMPWEVAAVLPASGQTAHTAWEVLGVREGETVLVHAAAGGVGTFAVQIAIARGATVIGTASEKNHEYLRSLGAIPVRYGPGLVERVRALTPDGVDAALDAAGADALMASVELVQQKERIGTIVAFELAEQLGLRFIRNQRSAERLQELVDLYRQGKLHITIREAFPLRQAAAAHRELESGHGRGKIVIVME